MNENENVNEKAGEKTLDENHNDGVTAFAEPPEEEQAEEEVPSLEAELATVKEQMLRIAAEAENTRKRAARDLADTRQYAVTGFAREMLDVADNLARALAAIPEGARETASEALGGLISGVELTDKNLHNALERNGVRKIDPKGERFNPNMHQAVAQIPANAPAGEVVEVIQPGYLLGERTLRAAMVAVSSGTPPAPIEPTANDSNDTPGSTPGSTIDTTA